jgi:hypothetical protein
METMKEPQKKYHNRDGFMNVMTSEILLEISKVVNSSAKDMSKADISLAIQNSKELLKDILSDSSFTVQSKISMAMISGITQSAARLKTLFKKLPSSIFKDNLAPLMPHIQQSGRDYLHTPAHYSTAFPGLALMGKLLVESQRIAVELKTFSSGDEKEAYIEKSSWTIEDESEMNFSTLSKFPTCLMFPSLGGCLMDNELQIFHESWYKWFYSEVVVGTNYSESWYSLTAADMHPHYDLELIKSEFEELRIDLTQITKKKLTKVVLWKLLEITLQYVTKSNVLIGDMPVNNWEDLHSV